MPQYILQRSGTRPQRRIYNLDGRIVDQTSVFRGDGKNKEIFREAAKNHSFQQFKKAVDYFQNEENIPRRFAKEIQDTYAMGEEQMAPLGAFLSSRKMQLPFDEKDTKDKRASFFDEQGAKWYDALEMMDLYLDLDRDICREERTNEQISNKNNTSE